MPPRHRIVTFPNGTRSLEETATGRAMHSRIGPADEARILYAEQSRLRERLSRPGAPLVVWDVGLGLAANAVAALDALDRADGARELRLVSFENDLDGLRTALARIDAFPPLARRETLLAELLDRRQVSGRRFRWELLEGDFSIKMEEAPDADVVFYDFYAPASCPELWSEAMFRALGARLAPDGVIYTYPSSTWTRIAMLLSGLAVGEGARTPEKSETTVLARRRDLLERPLTREWLEHKLAHGTRLAPRGELSAEDRARLRALDLSPASTPHFSSGSPASRQPRMPPSIETTFV